MNAGKSRRAWVLGAGAASLAALAAIFAHWQRQGAVSLSDEEKALANHIVRHEKFWGDYHAKPLRKRVQIAPPELCDFLAIDNHVSGFPSIPSPADADPILKADIEAVLANLPTALSVRLEPKLIGVYTLKGLGSSAYTEFVRDERGSAVASFIAVDVEAMRRTGNEWLTWKESSVFVPDPHWKIAGTLAAPGADSRRGALDFLLTHELAHAVALNLDFHPQANLRAGAVPLSDYDFASVGWRVDANGGDHYARKFDETMRVPGPIIYYIPSTKRPSIAAAAEYYDWLKASDFVTLYAATNPFDDFADSLASFVHTEIEHLPFSLTLEHDGRIERVVEACWKEARCAAKRQILEDFLKPPPLKPEPKSQ